MMRWLRGSVAALGLIYTLAIVAFLIGRTLPIAQRPIVDLISTFTLYLFLPLIPFLLAVIVLRSGLVLLSVAVPLAALAILYGPLFLPQSARAAAAGPSFTIMTFNVLETNGHIDAIVAEIKRQDPDIVSLQELSPMRADAVVQKLADRYPYRAINAGGLGDTGVLSRYPMQSVSTFLLQPDALVEQDIVLEVEGQQFRLFNVHLSNPIARLRPRRVIREREQSLDFARRDRQIAALSAEIARVEEPLVVTGDFNLVDQHRAYGLLQDQLGDTFREVGWGFGHTFPSDRLGPFPIPFPLVRIDYVWHSPEIRPLSIRVGNYAGSDHLPVIADLAFTQ